MRRGELIFTMMESEGQSIFQKDWWYGRIMEWSMKNEHFKTQMFRFVDVLPTLNSGSDVARHLKEYFAESGDELPSVFNFGLGLGSLAPGIMAGAIRKNVTQMAKMFITGESPQEALPVLRKQRKGKIGFTVDLLGEACLSEVEARDYQKKYLELISWLATDAAKWEAVPQIDEDDRGAIPRVNVSVKISALDASINLNDWSGSVARMCDRLKPLLREAMQRGVFLNLDMESYDLKDFTLEVFEILLLDPEFASYPHFGCVIQAYLRDSSRDVRRLIEFARKRGAPFTVRLVKGAYWDFETVHAQQKGWDVPVYTNKRESDANYEDCAVLLLQADSAIRLALGSHNVRSIAACMAHAERLGVSPKAFEIQMLYGMADPIKKSLVKQGYRVREYAPVGELIPGMAYLVRRLLENTSNESFLKNKFADNQDSKALLQDPHEGLQVSVADPKALDIKKQIRFHNEPNLDFGTQNARAAMSQALHDFAARSMGREHPLFIGGQEIKTDRTMESVNPSEPRQVVGRVALANPQLAEQAVAAAKAALPAWRSQPAEARASLLDRLADLMLRDRLQLNALEVYEVGKTWDEADADITEAIDFCRYYAKEMRRIASPRRVGGVPGELSHTLYRSKGVAVIIAPWNFPLAILCGMVAGALVTGNTVVFKPAEQSCVMGAWLMRLLREAGVPSGVVNLVQGYGEEIGDTLTGHPDVSLIGFTGSKDVGLHILQQAAVVRPGQRHIKKVICEMGGKNAIIVDSDADLDEATAAAVYSAFGFAGQKCSAASRLIVLEEVYDRFITRLVEATRSLKVGPAADPASDLGPVIDQDAQIRLLSVIRDTAGARLAFQAQLPETLLQSGGFFVPPTIFADVTRDSRLNREEFFGPVLAVLKAKSIDEAIEIANDSEYALTGGLFSRSPAHISRVRERLEVGNLYINRGITGALVERHPFGGFKLSGAGSKTGGSDYLLQFLDPVAVAENTLRRGFAPSEDETRTET